MNRSNQKQLISLILFCTIMQFGKAQFHEPVLTDMEGQPLLDQLVNQYKPATVYGYGPARDTLFSKVYMQNDSLTCVYSGHTIYLDPTQDPTTAAFQNGSDNGINTEHTYPQALGAGSGNARSDMHHLYPTKTPVNAARASFPFGEVPDNQTIQWFYLTQAQASIPSQNIDAYSELGSGIFEAREDHKGNIARAMFYFYTMYNAEANAADPDYFEEQKETLCNWHLLDPVDQKEWERNAIIASYQEGKKNPFILDCTLAERSYCAVFEQSCMEMTATADRTKDNGFELFQNIPNPVHDATRISYRLDRPYKVRLKLYDVSGRICKTLVEKEQGAGTYEISLEKSDFVNGLLYIYQLELYDGAEYHSVSRKLLKL